MTFSFTVPGPPVGWHTATPFRDKRTGKMRFVSPPAMRAYRERVRLIARAARPSGWRIDEDSYALTMEIYQRHAKPDRTDVLKLIEDALTGIAYVDDCRVDDGLPLRYRSPDIVERVAVRVDVLT